MDKNSDDLTRRVWLELEQIYDGDRDRMREALRRISKPGTTWSVDRVRLVNEIAYRIKPRPDYSFVKSVFSACDRLYADWVTATIEPSPAPSPAPPKVEAYNQLTLDFSATIEPIQTAPADEPTQKPGLSSPGGEKRSPVTFSEESIFLAISREGVRKGWLTPQYKFKVGLSGNSTTTKQFGVLRRTYGPYWVFCWNRPKKSDGQYYLGKVESPKFQHFCEIWESSEDLSEILRRLNAR